MISVDTKSQLRYRMLSNPCLDYQMSHRRSNVSFTTQLSYISKG
jgi:hypothetical protein